MGRKAICHVTMLLASFVIVSIAHGQVAVHTSGTPSGTFVTHGHAVAGPSAPAQWYGYSRWWYFEYHWGASWSGGGVGMTPYYPLVTHPNPATNDPSTGSAADAYRTEPTPDWLKPGKTPPLAPLGMPKPGAAGAVAKGQSEKALAEGDASFGKQKYTAAMERYRSAAKLAPDWADPHFRQAFALVALGDYRRAAISFRAGLRLRSDWSDSPFRLETIYAGSALAKVNARLADKLARDPLDPELLLAMGMQLYFDEQQPRSAIYLSQAASLQVVDAQLLDAFLEPASIVATGERPE